MDARDYYRSERNLVLGLLGVTATTVAAGMRAYKEARDESTRIQAISALKEQWRRDHPTELSDRLIREFDASGQSLEFDASQEVAAFYTHKLYKFLLYSLNEKYADAVMERLQKFERYEITEPLSSIFKRTAADMGQKDFDGELLQREHAAFLQRQEEEYRQNKFNPPMTHSQLVAAEEKRIALDAKERAYAEQLRTNLINDGTVHITDDGAALVIQDDYRCVAISNGRVAVFKGIGEFQNANPKNRRWQYIDDIKAKNEIFGPYLNEILALLFPRLSASARER
jgi:hypothetical protein